MAARERDEYLTAVAAVTALARRTPGCLDFVQSADPIDPERINIYERWGGDEALLAFRSSAGAGNESPSMPAVLAAEVAKFRISTVESP